MEETTINPDAVTVEQQIAAEALLEERERQAARENRIARLRLLWSRRRFLSRATAGGLVLATVIAFLIPKSFQATTQLMPPDAGSDSGSGLAMLAALAGQTGAIGAIGGDVLGVKSTGALFIGILRSRTVQDGIVQRFDLKKEYWTKFDYIARRQLEENTEITEDRKSGIITVTVTDHDPKRAAAIASAYVEELDTLIARVSTSSARRERIFLEDRLSGVKQDLEGAEDDFSQFASDKGTIDITEQGKAMVEAAATLEGQLIAAQSELEGLRQIYSDQNVRVRATEARIDALRQQLRRFGGKSENSHVDDVETASDPSYPTLAQLPILGVPFADKLRRMKLEEVVFETLTKQYELAKVQEAKEIPSVKVLDAPVVPEHKSFPPRLVIMVLGAFCGAILGMVWVLGQSRWQQIDPQDPGKALAEQVFHEFAARIPWISRNGSAEKLPEQEVRGAEGQQASAKSAGTGK